MSTPFRPVASRFPWEKDPNPLIQELDEERAVLLIELGVETDPVLQGLRKELIFSLESDIDLLRRFGKTQRRKA